MLWDSAAEGNGWGQTRPSQAWRNGPFFLLYLVPLVFYGWLKPVWDIGGSFYCLAWKKSLCKVGSSVRNWYLFAIIPCSSYITNGGATLVSVAQYLGFRNTDLSLPKFLEILHCYLLFSTYFYIIIVNLKACSAGGQIID